MIHTIKTFLRYLILFCVRPIHINSHWPENQPLISVVITSFNYGKFLPAAIESIQNQTFKNYEILLIEAGSTDDVSLSILKSYESNAHFRCFYQNKPTEIGLNRALGLKEAKGKYVLFLDADDMLAPTYLERGIQELEGKGVDLVAPNVLPFSEDLQKSIRENRLWQAPGPLIPEIFINNRCTTVSLFRRQFVLKNKINYPHGIHLEDWEFWCRLAAKGCRYTHLEQPLHYYRIHGSSITDSLKPDYQKHVSTIRENWHHFAHYNRHWKGILSKVRQITRPLVIFPRRNLKKVL